MSSILPWAVSACERAGHCSGSRLLCREGVQSTSDLSHCLLSYFWWSFCSADSPFLQQWLHHDWLTCVISTSSSKSGYYSEQWLPDFNPCPAPQQPFFLSPCKELPWWMWTLSDARVIWWGFLLAFTLCCYIFKNPEERMCSLIKKKNRKLCKKIKWVPCFSSKWCQKGVWGYFSRVMTLAAITEKAVWVTGYYLRLWTM